MMMTLVDDLYDDSRFGSVCVISVYLSVGVLYDESRFWAVSC
jgi:hypothetical protein